MQQIALQKVTEKKKLAVSGLPGRVAHLLEVSVPGRDPGLDRLGAVREDEGADVLRVGLRRINKGGRGGRG